MEQEEKQLLLKDLCARLSYGVKGLHRGQVHELFTIDGREANNACIQVDGYDAWFSVDTFKPYLRPMSSMTEKERKEYWKIKCPQYDENNNIINTDAEIVDWLNEHHFDYRGLIEKGLAIAVTEENNPYVQDQTHV